MRALIFNNINKIEIIRLIIFCLILRIDTVKSVSFVLFEKQIELFKKVA